MNARLATLALLLLALAGCSGPGSDPGPTSSADYAQLQSSPIRGLSTQQIDDLESGAGMQLALPAELNGFPGPRHVLELADRLGLNASQRDAVQALFNETNAKARAAGQEVLDAYEALDEWFRAGAGTDAELRALMRSLAEREAALRQVHLAAHVECRGLLTEHQVELYKDLRGYGGAHTGHAH